MSYLVKLKRFLYQEFMPVNKGLILLAGVVFVIILLLDGLLGFSYLLVLRTGAVSSAPWSLVTYPLINEPISLIFAAIALWFIGGSLERTWGSRRFSWLVFLVTLTTGVAFSLVSIYYNNSVRVYGLWIPLAAIIWAWSRLYSGQEVLVWGLIPVKAFWFGWMSVAMTFFSYYKLGILYGVASIAGIGVAHLFVTKGSSGGQYKRRSSPKRVRTSRLRLIK